MSEAKYEGGGARRNMEDRVDDLEERLRTTVEFKSDFGDKGGQCTLRLYALCCHPLGSSRPCTVSSVGRRWVHFAREKRVAHWLHYSTRAYAYGDSSASGA